MSLSGLFAEGMSEAMNTASENSPSFQMLEGMEAGQTIFIEIISRMEENEDVNYDVEYIINNYLGEIESNIQILNTKYDWIEFISTDEIIIHAYKYKTLLNLLNRYVWRKQEDNEIITTGASVYEEDY
jgi:hypothetical protein